MYNSSTAGCTLTLQLSALAFQHRRSWQAQEESNKKQRRTMSAGWLLRVEYPWKKRCLYLSMKLGHPKRFVLIEGGWGWGSSQVQWLRQHYAIAYDMVDRIGAVQMREWWCIKISPGTRQEEILAKYVGNWFGIYSRWRGRERCTVAYTTTGERLNLGIHISVCYYQ